MKDSDIFDNRYSYHTHGINALTEIIKYHSVAVQLFGENMGYRTIDVGKFKDWTAIHMFPVNYITNEERVFAYNIIHHFDKFDNINIIIPASFVLETYEYISKAPSSPHIKQCRNNPWRAVKVNW